MCDVTLLYISGVRKGALAGQEWHLHVQEVLIVASAAADFAFQLANEQYNNNDDHIVIIIINMKWCVAMSSYVVLPLLCARCLFCQQTAVSLLCYYEWFPILPRKLLVSLTRLYVQTHCLLEASSQSTINECLCMKGICFNEVSSLLHAVLSFIHSFHIWLSLIITTEQFEFIECQLFYVAELSQCI